jgi:hypothetical protein
MNQHNSFNTLTSADGGEVGGDLEKEDRKMNVGEAYLGDGVYAKWDGFGATLRTEREDTFRGQVDHWIYMEPEVYAALVRFWKKSSGIRDDHPSPAAECNEPP